MRTGDWRYAGKRPTVERMNAPTKHASSDAIYLEEPLLIPAILHEHDLPGPLTLNRLGSHGQLERLDQTTGYWHEHAATLYGRAMIAANILPYPSVACADTALWIWIGGDFPNTIDILTTSHHRTTKYGRQLRSHKRKTIRNDITTIGMLRVTSPTRTACDIAYALHQQPGMPDPIDRIIALMDAYDFTTEDCLDILNHNPYNSANPQAFAFFNRIRARRGGMEHGGVMQHGGAEQRR